MEADGGAGVEGGKGITASTSACACGAGTSRSGPMLSLMGMPETIGPSGIRVAVIWIGMVKPCCVTYACMASMSSDVRLPWLALR